MSTGEDPNRWRSIHSQLRTHQFNCLNGILKSFIRSLNVNSSIPHNRWNNSTVFLHEQSNHGNQSPPDKFRYVDSSTTSVWVSFSSSTRIIRAFILKQESQKLIEFFWFSICKRSTFDWHDEKLIFHFQLFNLSWEFPIFFDFYHVFENLHLLDIFDHICDCIRSSCSTESVSLCPNVDRFLEMSFQK